MYFRVVQPSRETFAFQVVHPDGRVCLTSISFPDRLGALRGIQAVITSLREGVEASLEVDGDQYRCSIRGADGAPLATGANLASPAAVDTQLADLQHWVATVERFRIEEPQQAKSAAKPVETDQGAGGYDLEQRSRTRTPGLELLDLPSEKRFSAQINDERGEGLLFLPGFANRFARDEQVESLLSTAAEPRRYDRREAEDRLYFAVNTRNGREIARSRWFADAAERDAAIAWLVRLAPDAARDFAATKTQREGAGSGPDQAGTAPAKPAGFEGFRGGDGQHYFRLNDERGEEVFVSHGYASAKARDNGIRTLLKAATDSLCYRLAADGASFTIVALNGRQLARSRNFTGREETDRVAGWIRREVIRFGKACGIRLWDSMIIEIPHDAEEASGAGAPAPTQADEVVDQPLRNLRVESATEIAAAPPTLSSQVEAPVAPEPLAPAASSEPVSDEVEVSLAEAAPSLEAAPELSERAALERSASALEVEIEFEPGAPAAAVDAAKASETERAAEATPVAEADAKASEAERAVEATPVAEADAKASEAERAAEATPVADADAKASEAERAAEAAPVASADASETRIAVGAGPVVVADEVTASETESSLAAAPVEAAGEVKAGETKSDLEPRGEPSPAAPADAPEVARPEARAPDAEPAAAVTPPAAETPAVEPQREEPSPAPVVSSSTSVAPAIVAAAAGPVVTEEPQLPRSHVPPAASISPARSPAPVPVPPPGLIAPPKPLVLGVPPVRSATPGSKPGPEKFSPPAGPARVPTSSSEQAPEKSLAPKPAPERPLPSFIPPPVGPSGAEKAAPKPETTAPTSVADHGAPKLTAERPLAPLGGGAASAAERGVPKLAAERPLVPISDAAERGAPRLSAERPLAPLGETAERGAPKLSAERPLAPLGETAERGAPKLSAERPLTPIGGGGATAEPPSTRAAPLRTEEPSLLDLAREPDKVVTATPGPGGFVPTMAPLVLERSGPNTRATRGGDASGTFSSDLLDMSIGDGRDAARREPQPLPGSGRRSFPSLIPPDIASSRPAPAPAAAAVSPAPAAAPAASVAPSASTLAVSRPRSGGPAIDRRLLGGALLVIAVVVLIFALRQSRGSERDGDGDAREAPSSREEPVTPSVAPAEPEPTSAEPEPASAQALPVISGCPEGGGEDPAIGAVVSPFWPVAGEPLRVLAATLAVEQPIAVQILTDDAQPVDGVEVVARGGLPASAIATWTPPGAGVYRIAIATGTSRVCHELRVGKTRERRTASVGKTGVWPVERAWTAGEEALYSAWVRELFVAPEGATGFGRLDLVTGDPARNLLFGALGLAEDRRGGVRLRPDGADLPYFLRAYWAWKRRLPFAFRTCSDRRAGQPPQCGEPRSNLAAGRGFSSRGGELGRTQRFFQRALPASVHAGNSRSAGGDSNSDLYPVRIDRQALRPGTLYVDPGGQVLVVVELADPREGAPGALYVVDGQPDGSIARKRFWEGSVVWHPDPLLGGTGFKRFRPAVREGDGVVQLDDAAIAESADHADLWTGHADVEARAFHDAVTSLIDLPPWDPSRVQREAAAALLELVQERVAAVDRGAAHARGHRRPIAMPAGLALFDAKGAWEDYSTPGRDLRLLAALDVVRAVPDRVRERPELFAVQGDAEAVAGSLERGLDATLREHRFTYRRSDGSAWELSLADVAARSEALERGYNPNDCPELRWGAALDSEEGVTCSFNAPPEQQELMEQNRDWFRARRPPARRSR